MQKSYLAAHWWMSRTTMYCAIPGTVNWSWLYTMTTYDTMDCIDKWQYCVSNTRRYKALIHLCFLFQNILLWHEVWCWCWGLHNETNQIHNYHEHIQCGLHNDVCSIIYTNTNTQSLYGDGYPTSKNSWSSSNMHANLGYALDALHIPIQSACMSIIAIISRSASKHEAQPICTTQLFWY